MRKHTLPNFIIIGIIILLPLFLLINPISANAAKLPKEFLFDDENALDEWEEKIFRNKVLYEVQQPAEGDGLLSATSDKACSGLLYRVKINTKKKPMISWEWKVSKFPDKTNASDKGGWIEQDDYAARVYVIFPSIIFTQTKSIEYIWAENEPTGKIMTSPYFKNIKLIVVESGKDNQNKWVFEERNIYEDYIQAFGKPPSRKVGAISLMTDTDNTLSTAEAYYKQIKVGYSYE